MMRLNGFFQQLTYIWELWMFYKRESSRILKTQRCLSHQLRKSVRQSNTYHKCNIRSASKHSSGIRKSLAQDFQMRPHDFKLRSWSQARVSAMGAVPPTASGLGLPRPAAGPLEAAVLGSRSVKASGRCLLPQPLFHLTG